MADVYFDNDISLRLAPLLRSAGHRVETARDLGRTAATDDAQLSTAARNRWVLVTHNRRDFTLLHDAWLTWPAAFGLALPPHPGILTLDHAPVMDEFRAIASLLERSAGGAFANRLLRWHIHDGWRERTLEGWEPYS